MGATRRWVGLATILALAACRDEAQSGAAAPALTDAAAGDDAHPREDAGGAQSIPAVFRVSINSAAQQ